MDIQQLKSCLKMQEDFSSYTLCIVTTRFVEIEPRIKGTREDKLLLGTQRYKPKHWPYTSQQQHKAQEHTVILIRKLSTREVSTIRFTCSLIEYCAENKNKMNRSPKLSIFHSVVQVTRFEENYKESNGDYGKQGGCSTGEGKNFTECIRYHRSPH